MRTKDVQRAFLWSEKNQQTDPLANYFFKICTVLGTFIVEMEFPFQMIVNEHIVAEENLYELRDVVAKKILKQIKGQKI
jgi:hypothetical protein